VVVEATVERAGLAVLPLRATTTKEPTTVAPTHLNERLSIGTRLVNPGGGLDVSCDAAAGQHAAGTALTRSRAFCQVASTAAAMLFYLSSRPFPIERSLNRQHQGTTS
jgi:hypothetical protein